MDKKRVMSYYFRHIFFIFLLSAPWQPTIFSKRQEEKYDSFQHFANISIGSNLTVFDETDVNIYCDVRSAGNSTTYPITWTRKVESAIPRDLLPGRNLIIRNIKKEDAGVYKCVVNDGIVNGDEMTSTIEVIRKYSLFSKVVTLFLML